MHKRKHKMFIFLGLVSLFPSLSGQMFIALSIFLQISSSFFQQLNDKHLREKGSNAFHNDFYSNFQTFLIKFFGFSILPSKY